MKFMIKDRYYSEGLVISVFEKKEELHNLKVSNVRIKTQDKGIWTEIFHGKLPIEEIVGQYVQIDIFEAYDKKTGYYSRETLKVKKTGKEYFGNFGKLMNEQKPNKLETSVQS